MEKDMTIDLAQAGITFIILVTLFVLIYSKVTGKTVKQIINDIKNSLGGENG